MDLRKILAEITRNNIVCLEDLYTNKVQSAMTIAFLHQKYTADGSRENYCSYNMPQLTMYHMAKSNKLYSKIAAIYVLGTEDEASVS